MASTITAEAERMQFLIRILEHFNFSLQHWHSWVVLKVYKLCLKASLQRSQLIETFFECKIVLLISSLYS